MTRPERLQAVYDALSAEGSPAEKLENARVALYGDGQGGWQTSDDGSNPPPPPIPPNTET